MFMLFVKVSVFIFYFKVQIYKKKLKSFHQVCIFWRR